MYYYEIYIRKENLESSDWYEFINKVYKYVSKFNLEILIVNNELRFYISVDKDLTSLATENFVLCRTEPAVHVKEKGCQKIW